MNLSRRGFLTGLAAAVAAPYVVRSGVLMPVRQRLIAPPLYFTDAVHPSAAGMASMEPLFRSAVSAVSADEWREVLDWREWREKCNAIIRSPSWVTANNIVDFASDPIDGLLLH